MSNANQLITLEHHLLKLLNDMKLLTFKSKLWETTNQLLVDYFDSQFEKFVTADRAFINIPLLGKINWEVSSYGKINSNCFFGLIEYFVWLSYKYPYNYSHIWDVGAHTGIDTVIMSLASNKVTSFEPSEKSFSGLVTNIEFNKLSEFECINAGLSFKDGNEVFYEIEGNSTANHFAGTREHHGTVTENIIQLVDYKKYTIPNFMKINIEGYESTLIPNFNPNIFDVTSSIIEIHSKSCMEIIANYAESNSLYLYSQMNGFEKTTDPSLLPTNNKEGYVILSRRNSQNWFSK